MLYERFMNPRQFTSIAFTVSSINKDFIIIIIGHMLFQLTIILIASGKG